MGTEIRTEATVETATESGAQPRNALEMHDIRIDRAGGVPLIDGVSLRIRRGEILALVGESGSGKTTTALSVLGHTGAGLNLAHGDIVVSGHVLDSQAAFRRARGRLASYVPQNPGTALNPSMRIAQALQDALGNATGSRATPADLLERVGLPGDTPFGRRFPHQLSGGQQQRVCIAGAIAAHPSLVILDEPTTGLDVISQDRILTELLRLRDQEQVAMLYITHDLAVAARIADTIAVMYAGHLVENGPARDVLRRPRHPYTRGLMASTPDHLRARDLEVMPGMVAEAGERPAGCAFFARCPQAVPTCETRRPELETVAAGHQVRCPRWQETRTIEWARTRHRPNPGPDPGPDPGPEPAVAVPSPDHAVLEARDLRAGYRSRRGTVIAADGISFAVRRAQCVALVGESGSGKTTVARALAGLHPVSAGQILLDGAALPDRVRKRALEQRRRIQIVFQNPAEALNPRDCVESTLARPARLLRGLTARAASAEVKRLLEAVRLPASLARRYPRELSGGERQRVAIARALAAGPDVMICDEITSALDVSVQAVVLELLRELRREMGLSMVFITHDLGVVASSADEVLVLNKGLICERGRTQDVLSSPRHEYTAALLRSAPSLSVAIEEWERTAPDPAS